METLVPPAQVAMVEVEKMLGRNVRMDNVMVDSTAVDFQRNVKNAVKIVIVLIIRNASMNFIIFTGISFYILSNIS